MKKLKKWKVNYTTTEGDSCSVWEEAETREEAESNVRNEYWDVKEIVQTIEIK